MTTSTPTPRGAVGSRVFLWIVLAILTALAVLGTAIAIRTNPLASETRGVSKFQFIEECKEAMAERIAQAKVPVSTDFGPPQQRAASVAATENGWGWQGFVTLGDPKSGQRTAAQFICEHDRKTNKTEITALQPVQ